MQWWKWQRQKVALHERGELQFLVAFFKFITHGINHATKKREFTARFAQSTSACEHAAQIWNEIVFSVAERHRIGSVARCAS